MQRQVAKVSDLGAIGFALAGFTFWVLADTSIKLVGQSGLPSYEMVAFLGLFMAVFLMLYALARRQVGLLRPHRLNRQVARACLDMGNNVCVVIALRHLTLTLFYILVFMAPMVIALLSAVFLREGLPWKRAIAIGAGFAGVVLAVHPWSSAREWDWIGFGACIVCVACFSVNMVWSRVLTQTESPESLAFFSGLVTAAVGFALMVLLHAEPLTVRLTTGLFAMGLFCALGTLCFYIAVKHTSAANVSQYHYTQLVTGALVSYLVWRDKPGVYVLLGGSLILAAGLYIAVAAREVVPLTEGS
ncbi:DMT family transporter [Acidobacterium sp. S8]|uniref:DMT family transporter n=1 Tax=Acidobacterium sp. S8 TaxID=1641854 RepID=UPI00131B0B8B|nr:DMT family transporter [Acidobacterium sp. S8]